MPPKTSAPSARPPPPKKASRPQSANPDESGQQQNQSPPQQSTSPQQQQQNTDAAQSESQSQSRPPPKKSSQPPPQQGGSAQTAGKPAPKPGPKRSASNNNANSNEQESSTTEPNESAIVEEDEKAVGSGVNNTTIIKSGSKRIFTAEEDIVAPFGNDPTTTVVFELDGLNYALYEGLKDVDDVKKRQFDNEVHQSVWAALEVFNIAPQNVHARVAPGVISAVLLRYQAGAHPSMVDADWSIRVHVTVKVGGGASAASIKRGLTSYATSGKAFLGVARLYQQLFDKIIERIKVDVVNPEQRRPTATGRDFHVHHEASYKAPREYTRRRTVTDEFNEDESVLNDREEGYSRSSRRPQQQSSRRRFYEDADEDEDDQYGQRSSAEERDYYNSSSRRRTPNQKVGRGGDQYSRESIMQEEDRSIREYRSTPGGGGRQRRQYYSSEEERSNVSYGGGSRRAPSRVGEERWHQRSARRGGNNDDDDAYAQRGRSPRYGDHSDISDEEVNPQVVQRRGPTEDRYRGSSPASSSQRRIVRSHADRNGGRRGDLAPIRGTPTKTFRGELVDRQGRQVSEGGFYVRVNEVETGW